MAAASAASEAERYRQFEAAEAQRRAEYDAAEVRRQAEWAAGEADRLRAIAQWEAEMREWQRDEEARVAAAAVAVRAAREAMEQRVRAVEERRASAERAAAERGGEAAGSENRPFTVFVRMMAGRDLELGGIHGDDLVDKLLLQVHERERIPVDQLRLVCPVSKSPLEPGRELFTYGIGPGWVIHMVRMLRGNGPERRSRPVQPQMELEPAEPFVPGTFTRE